MTQATMGTMGDKEIISDMLSTQRQITGMYNLHAGECKCVELRDTFLNLLKEEHGIQSELFSEMHARGWYPTKDAPMTDVNMAKQKFTSAS